MILGTSSIREVIAFPKNRSAFCPLTQAPSPVVLKQLAELGLLDMGGTQALPGSKEQQDLIDSLSWVSRININATERPAVIVAVQDAAALAEIVNRHSGEDEPLFSVVTIANRTRTGTEARTSLLAEKGELFKNAPAIKGGYFKVASILE
jgi:aspartyl-tRNA synthetase